MLARKSKLSVGGNLASSVLESSAPQSFLACPWPSGLLLARLFLVGEKGSRGLG